MDEERLNRLDTRLADIQAGIAEIRAVYESQHKRLDRVEKEVWGNDRPGLVAKVNTLCYGQERLWRGFWAAVGSVGVVILERLVAWMR